MTYTFPQLTCSCEALNTRDCLNHVQMQQYGVAWMRLLCDCVCIRARMDALVRPIVTKPFKKTLKTDCNR